MSFNLSAFKNKINKKSTINLGSMLFLIAAVYLICYVLISNDIAPFFSIEAVSTSFSHWTRHWHILAVGLLPIYVALMIFGAAMLGIYFGSTIHHWVVRFFSRNKNI